MLDTFATLVMALAGFYLIALGGASLLAPSRTGRFLLGFASSRGKHCLEMLLRIIVGGAILVRAPRLPAPDLFGMIGLILVLTSASLLLVPWKWHREFARRVVPVALRNLWLVGVVALALGIGVLGSAFGHWVL